MLDEVGEDLLHDVESLFNSQRRLYQITIISPPRCDRGHARRSIRPEHTHSRMKRSAHAIQKARESRVELNRIASSRHILREGVRGENTYFPNCNPAGLEQIANLMGKARR